MLVQSHSSVNVSGYGYTGGIAGYRGGGYIRDSYATGTVEGRGGGAIGGFIGYEKAAPYLVNVYATGAVTGSGSGIGSLLGRVGSMYSGVDNVLNRCEFINAIADCTDEFILEIQNAVEAPWSSSIWNNPTTTPKPTLIGI